MSCLHAKILYFNFFLTLYLFYFKTGGVFLDTNNWHLIFFSSEKKTLMPREAAKKKKSFFFSGPATKGFITIIIIFDK